MIETTRTSRDQANAKAAAERQSVTAYHARQRQANREAWQAFHVRQAATILSTALELAEQHRAQALALEEAQDE